MIQDIFPNKLRNEYNPDAIAKEEDSVIAFKGNELMHVSLDENGLVLPTVSQIGMKREYIYIFSLNDTKFFLLEDCSGLENNFEYKDIREIQATKLASREIMYSVYTGKHLRDWYRDNHFCGRCGSPMKHSETERAKVCTECGYTAYPRIMPAVIVGVTNGDTILLTKYRTGFNHNALIAGFIEIGETVEEAVAREVMEEAGIKVKNIRYYKSQPWGTANDILLGYYCDVDGDTTIQMDANELKYAQWVERDDIVLQPDDFSLTNEMMNMFKQGQEI